MTLTPETRLVVASDVVSQELDGELVLLSLGRAEYYGLNPTGTRVWNWFADSLSLGDVVQRVADDFDVDVGRARADVLELAQMLITEGLVTISDDSIRT